MNRDTIAAIATPPGVGGVGVVRVSGSAARKVSQGIIGRIPRPRYATLATFKDSQGRGIDQGLTLFFPGPRSFTGEDCLELQGHGGPVVLDAILARCLELGARLAHPGEFTQRAFLNGKLDLVQAESIADLISAATATAARLAMSSLQGVLSRRIQALVASVTDLRVFVEATLDFPTDDLDLQSLAPDQDAWFDNKLTELISATHATLAEAQLGARIRDGLTVVIAGRPNAGKSSLLNLLLCYDAAIVAPSPGTTRDLVRCDFEVDGLPVRLIDTAGIRESPELVEREGVRRARTEIALADLVLWVYDASLGFVAEELDELPESVPVTLIGNKTDLLQPSHTPGWHPEGVAHLNISALTGQGIDLLRQHLRERAGLVGVVEGSFVARRRHLDALRRAVAAAQAAREAFLDNLGLEIVALELADAQHAFGEITGEVSSDELLGQIFSRFCIGK